MVETLETKLNAIYEACGFRKFRMSKFEPYDLYAQNRAFLKSSKILTFTAPDGALLALKPDITLSIIKHNRGTEEKVYYNETVYRAKDDNWREFMQVGVESVGCMDSFSVAEVLLLALRSLACISKTYCLNVSNAGFVSLLLDELALQADVRAQVLACLAAKNAAGIAALAERGALGTEASETLKALMQLHLPLAEGISAAKKLAPNQAALDVLAGLSEVAKILSEAGFGAQVWLDFSLVNSMDYYNDIMFQGFIEGVPFSVLSGGRYDRLLQKMGKALGAVGFALYMDRIEDYLQKERRFDADLLLLYGADARAASLAARARAYQKQGLSVRCMREEAWEKAETGGRPRCKELVRFSAEKGALV